MSQEATCNAATSSIANETVGQVVDHGPFSLVRILTNRWFLHTVSIVTFFWTWDWLAGSNVLGGGSSALARPHEVLEQLVVLAREELAELTLWGHVWASTRRVVTGFSIAAAIAVPLGLFMALNRYVNAIVKPLFDLLKPMPPISWISISILWFGIGETSKVFIIVLGTFVPCLLNAYNGVRLVEPELYDVVRMLGGKRRDEILHVCFPASFPAIFAGLQISLSIAWTCVLAAELVSARSGLGYIIVQGMNLSQPAMVIGGMAVIAAAAWGTTLLVTALERKLCPWKRKIAGL
ncbi:ABC transporter permease [Nitratidesulfovibrio sp. HK-II]|uniref:ABC transporter permease n=1 Tax=Nitratidesulfovibrio sp. HK-II TaxID=2009266 RepID=UPI000E2FCA65|nr:ABC transporter permease [Nitratidesulfovibrio sp. HK-II]GBO95775.1 putative permease component of ABC transporter [Nitratidesulfovibrio sp. HK-II]